MKTIRAGITLGLALLIAAGAALGLWATPKLWHKGTKNAQKSTEASAQVEAAVQARIAADQARHASAAASIATIGKASADLPESPATDFVRAEVPVALAKLPAPDPYALLEAEKRRVAFMEGQRDLARSLYVAEADRTVKLEKALTEKEAQLQQSFIDRRAADTELEKAAAVQAAATQQRIALCVLAVVLAAGWIWTKVNGLSMATVGMMAADLRKGEQPMAVVNKYVPVRLWKTVNKKVRLETEPPDNSQPEPKPNE